MTILWCGGEDIDFPLGVVPSIDSSATYRRAGSSARCAFYSSSSASVIKSSIFSGGAVTSCWLSFIAYENTTSTNYRYIGLAKSGATVGALFIGSDSSTAAKLALWKWDGTTFTKLATEVGTSITSSSISKYDMQVTSYGAAANVKVYRNGNLLIDFTGDVTVSGITSLDSVWYIGGSYYWRISEVIVATEDTRLCFLETLYPYSAGDTNNWSGAFSDIDEVTSSDADKISSAYDNTDFQCNLSGLPAGTWNVKAVKFAVRCVDGSGSTGIQIGIKSDGTVDTGDTQTASGFWQTKERLMTVNPITSTPFTTGDVESLQANLRAKVV